MLVYIAAPLGDPDPAVRAWHRERANLLSALAFACNRVPVCVHAYAELAMGADADPAARERGLKASMKAAKKVAQADGAMWTLLRDDCTRSAGCEVELQAFIRGCRLNYTGMGYTWARWRQKASVDAPHLLPEFDRLATRPQVWP